LLSVGVDSGAPDPLPDTRRMAPDARTPPGQISTRTVYQSKWMSVREDTYTQPDGIVVTYGVVDKVDFAIVIAQEGNAFHLVEQFRYPIGQRSWEFPMGTWPAGRSGTAEDLARQELQEETGLTAANWRQLGGRMHHATGFCSQGFTVFHATDLTAGAHAREATESDMVQALVSEQEFRAMILDGRIVDGPTMAAYALFQLSG
jgi:8-oxo-dGTP pyrophosphatase MutT (NUDIX family)